MLVGKIGINGDPVVAVPAVPGVTVADNYEAIIDVELGVADPL